MSTSPDVTEPPSGPIALPSVTLADIQTAATLLEGVATRTPMEESRWLSELVGGPVLLKCENLQRTGSFKIRGAYLRMCRLTPKERARGVVAASAGNHAQGVALAAQMLGIEATVFMPHGAPIPKLNATRGYGATVLFEGTTIDDCLVAAHAMSAETGAVLIHPFDHADIVAGQGTCGLEIVEQAPHAATVVVPLGGGGFVAGIATAIKALRPDVHIVGVQAANAAAYPESLRLGSPQALAAMNTMADGIAVGRPGAVPFAAVVAYVDEVVTVSEESLSQALVLVLERDKMVVEPAGSAAVAAVMDRPEAFAAPVVVVLSGGNVDPLLLGKLITHGMAAAGRYLNLRVRIPDRPGGLATLLQRLAETGANVLEVAHERTSPSLSLNEVDVAVQVETRGSDHAEAMLTALRELGYRVD